MAKVILTKESRLADRILRCLPKKSQVAAELGISRQAYGYRFSEVYPRTFPEFIKMLDLAGYEIREKGEP
ncbi:MAG: hypothetical protein MSG78_11575 [Clostridiales bacterium]|nr:hypothetical protein [Clostridiales bacterium]